MQGFIGKAALLICALWSAASQAASWSMPEMRTQPELAARKLRPNSVSDGVECI